VGEDHGVGLCVETEEVVVDFHWRESYSVGCVCVCPPCGWLNRVQNLEKGLGRRGQMCSHGRAFVRSAVFVCGEVFVKLMEGSGAHVAEAGDW
jgi:hypothetical protein